METRASHLLVGSFVLLMVAAAFGFIMWLAKVEIDQEFDHYTIYFEGSVSGLSTAGEVRYNGVPVGSVQSIALDAKNPGRVKVGIEVAGSTPIKQDSVAILEMQGITGVSYVQLSGGSAESPVLTKQSGEKHPIIASKPSQIDELFAGGPELINKFIKLVTEATQLFDEPNRKAIGDILANVDEVTGTVADRSADIDQILSNVNKMSEDIRKAANSTNKLLTGLDQNAEQLIESVDVTLSMLRGTLSSTDEAVEKDFRPMLRKIDSAATSFDKMSSELATLLDENNEVLTDFFGEGLFEFTRLVSEMRLLVDNLNRVSAQLESDPAQFLFGSSQKGFKAK